MINAFRTFIIAALLGCTLAAIGPAEAARLDPGPGVYSFSGVSNLTGLGQDLRCTLTLTGSVELDSDGDVTLSVTRGAATGDFATGCSLVGFEFPWKAIIPATAIPANPSQTVPIIFQNVIVTAATRTCTDQPTTVTAQFSNGMPIDEPSTLYIDAKIGRCSVTGTFHAKTDVNLTR
ncbi:hypothetical protein [Salinisphaera aquimarina]|uniref:Uncharacterized protein n=1 Tax=Salinisphaera aquimarina TaxID=2094031 RepID=A0ABV7EUW0_9GAMM